MVLHWLILLAVTFGGLLFGVRLSRIDHAAQWRT